MPRVALFAVFALLIVMTLPAPRSMAAPPPPPACASMTFDQVIVLPNAPFNVLAGGNGGTTRYLIFGGSGTDIIRLQTTGPSCIVGNGGMDIVTAGQGPGDICLVTPQSVTVGCETMIH